MGTDTKCWSNKYRSTTNNYITVFRCYMHSDDAIWTAGQQYILIWTSGDHIIGVSKARWKMWIKTKYSSIFNSCRIVIRCYMHWKDTIQIDFRQFCFWDAPRKVQDLLGYVTCMHVCHLVPVDHSAEADVDIHSTGGTTQGAKDSVRNST